MMKMSILCVTAFGLLAFAGCGSGKPGGPGAGTDNSKPVVGTADNAFTLGMPLLSTKIRQGETKDVTISISRGKNFDQDVAIQFANVPQGVTIAPMSPMLLKSDKEVHVTITAADDAAVNDFTVGVTGHPATGPDAKNELKLTVAKKS